MLAGKKRPPAGKRLAAKKPPPDIEKEKHLLFDESEVVVRSGAGGHGAVISLSGKGDGPRLKRTSEDDFELPPGGGQGGDVILFVDPSLGDLLHLRGREVLAASRGGDSLGLRDLPAARQMWRELVDADSGAGGDPALSSVPSSLSAVQMRDAEPLRVPVPPGTFVRTKGGRVLGDLVAPGQEICVATGGSGGPCVLGKERSTGGKGGGRGGGKSSRRGKRRVDEDGLGGGSNMEDAFELNESELHALTRGSSPTEVKLSLVMRTVADVGFVGFPNAGKSTLLKALSRASPEIAPFPFTTLMPNLGAMALDETDQAEGGRPFSKAAPTVLADLPGLVEGAHEGKGLGRLFLRHLRRVRVVLYVLDTSCEEPSIEDQYDALRNELRLYNPHYLERPHVVVLSKLDLPLDAGGEEALAEARRAGTRAVSASATRALEHTAAPVEIVPVSGLKGKGLRILKQAIEKALDVSRELEGGAGGKNQPS